MGIQGLLPQLKSIMQPIHVKDLDGCSVAIDTYSWLHKGALSCSKDLCKGLPTNKHIDYCMHRVHLLQHYNIKPILVFDGGPLPMKSEQEIKRERSRKENLSRAMEHESNGNSTAAYECYQKAVDISPSIAHQLIQVLKQENISYVVAPYEADAQMTFLAITKQVDAVITEDSDLIAFGCPRIIYKMDKFGQGVEFCDSLLQQNKDLNFYGFTKQMLLEMCILSGCDYLQSLPGMGLKRAHTLITKFRTYDKVIKHLKYNTSAVPPLYEESFQKAIMTFQHQSVYDPLVEDIVHLLAISNDATGDLEFLGPPIPQDVAKGIAKGEIDPITKIPFQQREDNGAEIVHDKRYMVKTFKPESERKKLELPAEKNLLTNYFCFASREAKRNFRTPRVTPPETGSKNGTPTDTVDLTVAANSTKLDRSSSELFDSRDSFDVDPPVNHDDSGRTSQGSGFLNSSGQGTCEKNYDIDGAGVRHSLLHNRIHKPCIMLQKERSSHTSEVKMKLQNGDVVVRSSYFLHKYVKKSEQGNESSGEHEHVYLAEVNNPAPYRSDVQVAQRDDFGKGSEHSHLEEALVKDDVIPFKKYSYAPVSSSNESRLKSSNRKICASAYFKENSMKRNTQECEILDIPDVISESYGRHIHEDSNPSGCYPIEAAEKKRKTAPGDTSHTNDDPSLRGASLHIESNYTPEKNSSPADMKADEGKFGCNISHIGQYSDVAEKSMQKFISTISSYRYTSSGSRASGLRAPLKEIRNTTTEKSPNLSEYASINNSANNLFMFAARSPSSPNLSKYAYVPTKLKASRSRRKA